MSKPFSIRTEPWTGLDRQAYSTFSDDFVHSKLLTFKVNTKSDKGGVNLKESVSKKGDSYKTEGEIKLWFPVCKSRGGSLYFRSKGNEIKVLFDDGLKEATFGHFTKYNFYASYQSEKSLKNIVLKAGANLLAKQYSVEHRARVGLSEGGDIDFSTGHKFGWSKDCWSFAAYNVVNWKAKTLINNALRFGYHKGGHDFFLRAENKNSRSLRAFEFGNLDSYFTAFTFDALRKVDDQTKLGVEAEFTKNGFKKSTFLVQRSIPSKDSVVKLRLTSDKSAAIAYQSTLKGYGKWVAGWEVSDIGKANKSQFGLQFEVNL